MIQASIALGANLPSERDSIAGTLSSALKTLAIDSRVSLLKTSRWYRSPAFPTGSGPDFVNGAALIETELTPRQLLELLHNIESKLGRQRSKRWAPRICDLDLLFVEDAVLPDIDTLEKWMKIDLGKAQTVTPPHLILPHPRLHERAFVLVPLNDVSPNWRHPLLGATVREMLSALPPEDVAKLVQFSD